ncbi:MAG: Peptidase family, partial [Bacteroidetes bacterium]|nr:Peptidase family [Bacteroidota bacterium]
ATLEIVEPTVPPDMRVLADYRRIPASLVMWSGPTPSGGVTAEVIELKSFRGAELDRIDVRGKFVLVEGSRGSKARLYRMGAAGMISSSTENPELINDHYWVNSWGDNGWGYTKASSPLVGFSITPRQGAYLRSLLARNAKVRVKAVVDSRYYSGSYPYATGVLEGDGSDEEVLELGHTTEQGANDNATGVASMLESLATLNRLIDAGKLERPKRSIRILAMPELYGSMPYILNNPERIRRTIGAICLDTAAGPYDMAGTEYTIQLNPDVARSYQDALILRVAEQYYAGLQRRFPRWAPYRTGTDTFLSDPMIGVPTVRPTGGSGVNVHHNSADTVDRVDPRSLLDLTVMVAGYLYYLASAGEGEIPWLAEITASRSYENIVRAAEPFLDRVASATGTETLGRELYVGMAKIAYTADRDQDAVLSTLRLAPAERREKNRPALEPLLNAIRRFASEQSDRLQRAADRRALQIGTAVPVKALSPPQDPRRAEASRIIVTRKRPGTITLDDLPAEQRGGFPSGAWDVPLIAALNWCDGRRTLAEVIRLTELEQGPMNFDFVGYFKFLARHGYVEITTASE